jgi:hypothetical protein
VIRAGAGGGMGRAGGSSGDVSALAKFILQAADLTLPNAQDLSALANGPLLNTAGVLSKAIEGTDFGTPDVRSLYVSRLRTACGLTAANSTDLWQDFTLGGASGAAPPGWEKGAAGTGSASCIAAGQKGGVCRLTSGATHGAVVNMEGRSAIIGNVATDRGGFAARFTISTTVDAQTRAVMGFLNLAQNKSIEFGFIGALDAANFILQYDGLHAGSSVSLGLAGDQTSHIVEGWFVGDSKLHVRIDGGADVGPVTMSSAPTDSLEAWMHVANGTTDAARNLDVDWVLYVVPKAA